MPYNPRKDLTPAVETIIRENYLSKNDPEIAMLIGVSTSKVYVWRTELKLSRERRIKRKEDNRNDDYYFNWNQWKKVDFILNNV